MLAKDCSCIRSTRSVTKSVVALVLGAAVDRGLLKLKDDLDTPVLDLLPQYADLHTSEKDRQTVVALIILIAVFVLLAVLIRK